MIEELRTCRRARWIYGNDDDADVLYCKYSCHALVGTVAYAHIRLVQALVQRTVSGSFAFSSELPS